VYVELVGIALLVVYFVSSLRSVTDRRLYVWRYAVIACAAWLAESIAIYGYGFYEYSSSWQLRLGNMPLLVVLAWPAMIFSARDLAAMFVGSERRVAIVTTLIVLLDAAFMEPICVEAGLWRWNYPGVLHVPIIGMLGWGVFAGACAFWLSGNYGSRTGAGRFLLAIVGITAITHAVLLAAWWSVLRFVTVPISDPLSIAGIWVVVIGAALCVLARRSSQAIPLSFRILRTPVALLISSLMLQSGANIMDVAAYATAVWSLYGLGIAVNACARLHDGFRLQCAPNVGRASPTRLP
jgi:hypothetical protein